MNRVAIVLTPNPLVIELCIGILNPARDDDPLRSALINVAGVISVESGEESLFVNLSKLADYNDGWLLQELVDALCRGMHWTEVQEELLIWHGEPKKLGDLGASCTRVRLRARAVPTVDQ